MIAAMDENRLIGVENSLPWKLPADMKWFVANTKHKPIIVGRKTYESFGGKPLKERLNIVISRDESYQGNGATVVNSPEQAIEAAAGVEEVMLIGGASFYEYFMPLADKLYLTRIHGKFKGDAWFPDINESQWDEIMCEHHKADEKNSHDYSFYIYQRKQ